MSPLNVPEFTVSEFSQSIKRVVEDAFGYVRLKGEITGFKRAASGHVYFSLKDENANISAVCFRNAAQLINFEIGDGLQVVASGKITTYEGRSNYQIIVEKLEIAGVGAILEMIEKRRQKLLAEGLFDEIHKKPIPFFPKKIGVITSETGAVIQDIKHRVSARFPTHLVLYPTLVQGEKASSEIIAGIKFFNALPREKRPDVLIVARGGGSFEDLLPFSDEALIREVFKSEIPLISAVGHETDTTLIDYVSDLRAPTPTAAAELATPVLSELKNDINFLDQRLKKLAQNFLKERFLHLHNLQKYLVDPEKMLQQVVEKFLLLQKRFEQNAENFFVVKLQKLQSLQISGDLILQKIINHSERLESQFRRLDDKVKNNFSAQETFLASLSKLLKTNHYREILQRGFALVKDHRGALIQSSRDIVVGQEIVLEMADGEVEVMKSRLV